MPRRKTGAIGVLPACFFALLMPVSAQPPDPIRIAQPIETVTPAQVLEEMGGPTLVTLHHQDAALQTIYEDLFAQAGIKLHLPGAEFWERKTARLSVDIKEKPFWDAMLELEPLTGLWIERADSAPFYELRENGIPRGAVFNKGAFPILFHNVEESPLAAPVAGAVAPQGRALWLWLQGLADPKFLWVRPVEPRFDEVLDDQGHSLLPQVQATGLTISVFGLHKVVAAQLWRPAKSGRRIASARGVMRYFVLTKSENWVVENPVEAAGQARQFRTSDGIEYYAVEKVEREGTMYRFYLSSNLQEFPEIGFAFTPPPPPNPKVLRVFPKEFIFGLSQFGAWLENEKGQALPDSPAGIGGVGLNWKFNIPYQPTDGTADNKPARLVWRMPLEIKLVEVPFEFKDIPLPEIKDAAP